MQILRYKFIKFARLESVYTNKILYEITQYILISNQQFIIIAAGASEDASITNRNMVQD
jgi:hypothetical protein